MLPKTVVLCLALIFILSSPVYSEPFSTPVRESGQGKLYQTEGLSVVVLQGNWYEMGYQYGALLKDEMKSFNAIIQQRLGTMNLIERTALHYLVEAQLRLYPHRISEIQRGMMAGSGLSRHEIAILEHYFAVECARAEGLFCSAISVWGPYTTNGELIIGRNFDFPGHYRQGFPYFCLAIFRPTDGSIATATLGYVGQIGSVSFFNAAGLVGEFNVADNLLREPPQLDRINASILLTLFGFDCATLEQFHAAMMTSRFNFPLLCTVADAKQSWTYEAGISATIRREQDEPGLNTVANWAIDPAWRNIIPNLPDPKEEMDERQENLRRLAKQFKGKIDMETMKEILDVKVGDGGAVVAYVDNEVEFTLHQFIYFPSSKQLVVRQPFYEKASDWISIDIGLFFP